MTDIRLVDTALNCVMCGVSCVEPRPFQGWINNCRRSMSFYLHSLAVTDSPVFVLDDDPDTAEISRDFNKLGRTAAEVVIEGSTPLPVTDPAVGGAYPLVDKARARGLFTHSACWKLSEAALGGLALDLPRFFRLLRAHEATEFLEMLDWGHHYDGAVVFGNPRDNLLPEAAPRCPKIIEGGRRSWISFGNGLSDFFDPWNIWQRSGPTNSAITRLRNQSNMPIRVRTGVTPEWGETTGTTGDSFKLLSPKLRHRILEFLPTEDVRNAQQVSTILRYHTLEDDVMFWRPRFERGGEHEYYFELALITEVPAQVRWRNAYYIIKEAGPGFCHKENRRRVWGLLTQIVDLMRVTQRTSFTALPALQPGVIPEIEGWKMADELV